MSKCTVNPYLDQMDTSSFFGGAGRPDLGGAGRPNRGSGRPDLGGAGRPDLGGVGAGFVRMRG